MYVRNAFENIPSSAGKKRKKYRKINKCTFLILMISRKRLHIVRLLAITYENFKCFKHINSKRFGVSVNENKTKILVQLSSTQSGQITQTIQINNKPTEQMDENGFFVIEDFASAEEIKEIKNVARNYTYEAVKEGRKALFSTIENYQSHYFMESVDKISYFYEKEAFDENADLQVDVEFSLNKAGHGLHIHEPAFKNITFSDRVKDVCRKLQLHQPVVVQSMYIYKNPKIGGEVKKHQDSTYLYTEPVSLYGFWLALDDATEENGCLWILPSSHKNEVSARKVKNTDLSSPEMVYYKGEIMYTDDNLYVPVPVKKGTCVLLHGNVFHYSLPNKSAKPRNAYIFHVFDKNISKWDEENWIQTNFVPVYESL